MPKYEEWEFWWGYPPAFEHSHGLDGPVTRLIEQQTIRRDSKGWTSDLSTRKPLWISLSKVVEDLMIQSGSPIVTAFLCVNPSSQLMGRSRTSWIKSPDDPRSSADLGSGQHGNSVQSWQSGSTIHHPSFHHFNGWYKHITINHPHRALWFFLHSHDCCTVSIARPIIGGKNSFLWILPVMTPAYRCPLLLPRRKKEAKQGAEQSLTTSDYLTIFIWVCLNNRGALRIWLWTITSTSH